MKKIQLTDYSGNACNRSPKKYHDYKKDAFLLTPYQHKKRPHLKFEVRCKVGDKWQRRFFRTQQHAKSFIHLRRIELRNEGEAGLAFPAELRVAAQQAAADLAPFGKSIADAVEYYLAHLRTERGSVPVHQAVEELIANRRSTGASALYLRDLKYRLQGRFVRQFGERSVASITPREVVQFLHSLNAAPTTRNTFRRDMRTLFSFCVDLKYCVENPVAGKQTLAKVCRADVEVLTVEQAKLLLQKASTEMLSYWAIGLFAGLRPSEIRKLDWHDVDFEDALLTVRASKTDRKRYVKMQPVLIEWLRPHRRSQGKVVAPRNFRKACRADKTAAGLHEWPTNCLRHSFGSYWLAQHGDKNRLALEMGNSPSVITAHYERAVRPKEAHLYWALTPDNVTTGDKPHEQGKVIARIGA